MTDPLTQRNDVADRLARAIAELRSGDDLPSLRRAVDDIQEAEIDAVALWEHLEEQS